MIPVLGGPGLSATRAQTNSGLTTIYTFSPRVNSTNSDGVFPRAGLVEGQDGFFYGTTYNGGAYGWGTIYRITPAGEFKTLAHFNGANGYSCSAPLLQARDGCFYGTATGGGANFYGTVFRVTTNGVLTALHSFTHGADGAYPLAGLVEGPGNALYGTASAGGIHGQGTVFKLTTTGVFSPLFSFAGTNGAWPKGELLPLADDNGNFLGTTESGGAVGAGTVFKISPTGGLIASFSFGYTNGSRPGGALVLGNDGSFYGTTRFGGSGNGTNGYGSVFRMSLTGTLTTVAFFDNKNGGFPTAGLMKTRDGSLYGSSNFSLYRVMRNGTIAAVALFVAENYRYPYGLWPSGLLLEGRDGSLYGVTDQGGTNTSQGTIFRQDLRPSLLVAPGTAETCNLSWKGIPGQVYQVQYTGNLADWLPLGEPLTALNSPPAIADTTAPDSRRFYRVVLLP